MIKKNNKKIKAFFVFCFEGTNRKTKCSGIYVGVKVKWDKIGISSDL
jgi:hypothetical protein